MLSEASLSVFDFLPDEIRKQLLLDRDPHGNVQVGPLTALTAPTAPTALTALTALTTPHPTTPQPHSPPPSAPTPNPNQVARIESERLLSELVATELQRRSQPDIGSHRCSYRGKFAGQCHYLGCER